MKKKIALGIIVIVSVGLLSFQVIKKAGKAGNTGSPGENSCNQCHNSFAINSSDGFIKFSSNIPGDIYEPDSVYTINVTVGKPGVSLFGFGLEALKTGNTSTGTFIITNSIRTQQLTAANGRLNMVHKLIGGAFPDSAVFSFDWRAPSTNVGPITFYYSGVCADSSNNALGDYVYKGSHTISSTSTVGIANNGDLNSSLIIRPFPSGQFVDVILNLNANEDIELSLLSMDGKLLQTNFYPQEQPGEKTFTMYTHELNSGVYILQAKVGNQMVTKKFLLMQ